MNPWDLPKERQLINEHGRQTLLLQRSLERTDICSGEQLTDQLLHDVGQVWIERRFLILPKSLEIHHELLLLKEAMLLHRI